MPARVADANVVGAIIFEEPRAEEADALIRGTELYAPRLLAYELTSIARKKTLLYPEKRDAIAQALDVALAMDIQWVDVAHGAVLRLALEKGVTTYDATYLHVARSLGVPLVTFDQRLHAATQDGGG